MHARIGLSETQLLDTHLLLLSTPLRGKTKIDFSFTVSQGSVLHFCCFSCLYSSYDFLPTSWSLQSPYQQTIGALEWNKSPEVQHTVK